MTLDLQLSCLCRRNCKIHLLIARFYSAKHHGIKVSNNKKNFAIAVA